MPAPLSMSKADIVTPANTLTGVSLVIRGGHATARQGRDVVLDVDVSNVQQLTRTTWSVTTVDGDEWTVTRAKGCGCGG